MISQTERFHVFALFLLYGSQIFPVSYSFQTLTTLTIYTETLLVVQHCLITAQVKEKKKEITHANFFVVISQKLSTKRKKMSIFSF